MVRGPSYGDEVRLNLKSLLSKPKTVLILGHHNADPDAVCSMIAFSGLLKTVNPDVSCTLACDDVSRLSKQVVSIFSPEVEILEKIEGDNYDLTVVLDTNSHLQLGSMFEKYLIDPSRVLVIDHHEENPAISELAEHVIVKSDLTSTCELLTELFDKLEIKINEQIANLLLTGMIFDTRRFVYADKNTLALSVRLIEHGANYQRCVSSLVIRPDRSERIARLKAAGRLKIHPIGDWVIVTAKVGAYEASACRGLIGLGADVAIVGGKPTKEIVRISARSTTEFFENTGVNLGKDVLAPLGEIIDGKGGGHPNAAGANGTRNRKAALSRSVEIIRAMLKESAAGAIKEST